MNQSELDKLSQEAQEKAKYEVLTAISHEDMEKVFHKWLLIKDPGVLKLLAAIVMANKLKIDPVWVFLVAPSGGGKTEMIQAMRMLPEIFILSNLTPQTFISGMAGVGKSLLFKLNDKIVAFKDFTTILAMRSESQSEILSQLREIYDGYFRKEFGTGTGQVWEGKLGFVAGVTSVVDKYNAVHKSLGERFLQYRIQQPDRKEVAGRIRQNIYKQKEMRKELAESFAAYIKGLSLPEKLPVLEDSVDGRIIELSDLVSRIRSAVFRDVYSREKEIVFVPEIEMSTRIYAQLSTIAIGLMVINGGVFTKGDYEIIYKLGTDSVHYLKMKVLNALKQYKGWIKTSTLALDIDYSTHTTREYLEELTVLALVERSKPRENLDIWRLRPEVLEMWKKANWDDFLEVGVKTDKEADSLVEPEEAQGLL